MVCIPHPRYSKKRNKKSIPSNARGVASVKRVYGGFIRAVSVWASQENQPWQPRRNRVEGSHRERKNLKTVEEESRKGGPGGNEAFQPSVRTQLLVAVNPRH